MRRKPSSRRLHNLLLPILLLTTSAVGQEKSVEAMSPNQSTGSTVGATSLSVDKESKEKAKADASNSQKTTGVAHSEFHPDSALTAKDKRSMNLFTPSKMERLARPDEASNGKSPVPQEPAAGGESAAELSKKLSNPVSSLISFPVQTSFDFGMGTGSGWRMTTNVQPVIPVALNKEWNLISRTIIPIIHQGNVVAPGSSQTGLGDVVQSFFISPSKTEPFIWGVGPAVLIPTATNQFLGSKQLGLGPTAVVLKQQHGWTVGALWNHIWRVAGGSGRPRVNADFIQPFLAYSTKDGWSYTVNTESTYDWTGNHWAVPIHFQVAKIVRFGKQPVSFGGALRCWATSPTGGPEGCGPRIVITGIFPKK